MGSNWCCHMDIRGEWIRQSCSDLGEAVVVPIWRNKWYSWIKERKQSGMWFHNWVSWTPGPLKPVSNYHGEKLFLWARIGKQSFHHSHELLHDMIWSQAPLCSLLFVTPMNPGFLRVQCDISPKDGMMYVQQWEDVERWYPPSMSVDLSSSWECSGLGD